MPEVNLIGTILSVSTDLSGCSLTWSIVPGNHGWLLKQGKVYGETHSAYFLPFLSLFPSSSYNDNGFFTISHPFDVHYSTSTSDGWPIFVCEVKMKRIIPTFSLIYLLQSNFLHLFLS